MRLAETALDAIFEAASDLRLDETLLIRSLYRRCFKVLFRPNDLEAEAEIFGRSVRLAG